MRHSCVAFVASTLLFAVALPMNPEDRVPRVLLPPLAAATAPPPSPL